jgi:hypothetical protein
VFSVSKTALWAGRGLTVKRADLNADGEQDYVLDGGSVGCEGFASLYGDREKGVTGMSVTARAVRSRPSAT